MQCDCGHSEERRGNIPRDESASAAIFDKLQIGLRGKDKKFTRGDAEKMFRKKLASAGEKLLPVDANQAETQLRDF
jgi:hypothetical protein